MADNVFTDELGIESWSHGSADDIFGTDASFMNIGIYDDMGDNNIWVKFAWYNVERTDPDGDFVDATLITDPDYIVYGYSAAIGNSDPTITPTINGPTVTIGGYYSNASFGNNIQGIWHNGVVEDYDNNNWGVAVPLTRINSFYEIDVITSFVIAAPYYDATYTIVARGYLPDEEVGVDPPHVLTIQPTQRCYNFNISGGDLDTYMNQTFYGRGILPVDADEDTGEVYLNNAYFNGKRYSNAGEY